MLKLEAEIFYERMPDTVTTFTHLSLPCVTVHAHKSVLFRLLLYTDPTIH